MAVRFSNGRLAKKKVKDKYLKVSQGMIHYHQTEKNKSCREVKVEGKRVVDLKELGKNLICGGCDKTLSLNNIQSETLRGLDSFLKIECKECCKLNIVHSSKKKCIDGKYYSGTNLAAVFGAVHSGAGEKTLNKVLACLNIPGIPNYTYKRYEKIVGSAIENVAKESCIEAAKEERALVISNVEEISNSL